MAATPPEPWKGCLSTQRMNDAGTTAELAATSTFFETPGSRAFSWSMFDTADVTSYACETAPLPANYRGQRCYSGTRLIDDGRIQPLIAPQESCKDDTTPMLRLSTDATAVRAGIDALVATGQRTHSAMGVLWAQRMLDPSWREVWGGGEHPADPNTRRGRDVRKAIILLTDGKDTQCGIWQDCAGSDLGYERETACDAAKAAGSEIFVVAAMPPTDISSALGQALRACSSEADNPDGNYVFLDNSTPDEIEAAFEEIHRPAAGRTTGDVNA